MNASEHIAEPDEALEADPPPERPETARPPRASDAPLDDAQPGDFDIDELLPVAFNPAALRVAMGPDLAELLRAAEERLEARGGTSQQSYSIDEGAADVPVPDDVMAMLAEPLEAADDDDGGTGAAMGSSVGATGAGRAGTRDVPAPTPHGQEEDLEQILPRAKSIPAQAPPNVAASSATETPNETISRALTGAGRADVTPFPEPPRASKITGQSITDEHPLPPETPLPHAVEPSPRDLRQSFASEREEAKSPRALTPNPAIERRIYSERGPVIDLAAASPGSSERAAVTDRQPVPPAPPVDQQWGLRPDRPGSGPITPISSERVTDRHVAPERAASSVRIAERPLIEAPRSPTLKMAAVPAIEMTIESAGNRSRASVRTEAVPAVLGPGDAPRALGRAIASRISGAIAITSGDDQRRVILHDGDVVTSGSTAPLESLVAFLSARGDIDRDLVPRLAGKLPPFGRHAGAALVAHGYLGQDDLWPVLRAHAEWVMGRALLVESGVCEVEPDPPARYKAEPGVFGGATGAEVFVEAVRRVVTPEVALARLGGPAARIAPGPRIALLAECALASDDEDRVRASAGHMVREVAGDDATERCSVLYALWCLDVIDVLPAAAPAERSEASMIDPLDDEAVRAKVRARLALVEEGDYFSLLGVSRGATSYDIRRAYLDLRRTFEPSRLLTASTADLADDVRLVVEVLEEAYEILRDSHRRERYRRAIDGPPR